MTLRELAMTLGELSLYSGTASNIERVSSDSRDVDNKTLFVAVRGVQSDGHRYIDQALEAGAAAVMVEDSSCVPEGTPALVVPDSAMGLANAAAILNGDPSKSLITVGITGTNGKTSITYILEAILRAAQAKPLVIGTVGVRLGGWHRDSIYTTPDAVALQSTLAEGITRGATHSLLEVSSHALQQHRADNVHFDVVAFTNLTQDHLDYHHTMEAYFQAKAKLFSELIERSNKGYRSAVICGDQEDVAKRLLKVIPKGVDAVTYGFDVRLHVFPLQWQCDLQGLKAELSTPSGPVLVGSRLVGEHNLSNIMGAVAIAQSLNVTTQAIEQGLRDCSHIPGRLQSVVQETVPVSVFVDFAHTPEALIQVAKLLSAHKGAGHLTTVFGCGGDRDQAKRPLMAQAAAEYSDKVIITTDNPRGERPEDITSQAFAGVEGTPLEVGVSVVVDRKLAIHQAILGARDGDVVLIAGKGHESYQEIQGQRFDFSDAAVASEALLGWGAHNG